MNRLSFIVERISNITAEEVLVVMFLGLLLILGGLPILNGTC